MQVGVESLGWQAAGRAASVLGDEWPPATLGLVGADPELPQGCKTRLSGSGYPLPPSASVSPLECDTPV